MMGSLLLYVVLAEAGVSMVLISGRPSVLYSTFLWAIQSFNKGRPFSVAHKGFAGSLVLALTPNLFQILKVRRHIARAGLPTASSDSFLLQTHILEAWLVGLAYYLFIIICQLHCQICGIDFLKRELELSKRKGEKTSLGPSGVQSLLGDEMEPTYCQRIDALESMVVNLRKKIEDLQVVSKQKDEEIRAAEAYMKALGKQSEGFLLEYDRLLEDNQALRGQLSLVDRKLYHGDSSRKKS